MGYLALYPDRKFVSFPVDTGLTGDASACYRRAEMIERSGGRTSVPQIFVDGSHLGNCQEMLDLEAAGRLAPILEAVN